ncbi:MAG: hypothetical protein KAI47_20175, partial [Deltaproteobacteria bacterium]|nr:hypothetical protein [Deltaproteobacteria bacterium]
MDLQLRVVTSFRAVSCVVLMMIAMIVATACSRGYYVPKDDSAVATPDVLMAEGVSDSAFVRDLRSDSILSGFRCEPQGSATTCVEGHCTSQLCPLGCNETEKR